MPSSPVGSLDKAVSIAGGIANALLLYARTVALSDNALAIAALVSVRSDVLDRMERLGASASDREAVQAAKSRGHTSIPIWEMDDLEQVISRLPNGKNVYLSLMVCQR